MYKEYLSFLFWCFSTHGLLPSKGGKVTKYFYLKFLVMYSLPFGTLISSSVYIARTIKVGADIANVLDDMILVLSGWSIVFLLLSTIAKADEITQLAHDFLSYIHKNQQLDEFDTLFKTCKVLSMWVYIMLSIITIVIATLKIVVTDRSCIDNNASYGTHSVCGMIIHLALPFDFSQFPMKQLVIAAQYFGLILIVNSAGSLHVFLYLVVLFYRAQFRNLAYLVRQIDDKVGKEKISRLREWIYLHSTYMSIIARSNGVLWLMSTAGLVAHISIALLLLQISLTRAFNAMLLLFLYLMGQFVLHQTGQTLINENEKLMLTVYDTKWYRIPPKYRYLQLLIILRTQKHIGLKLGPINYYSSVSFLWLIKTSYSFMSIMMNQI